MSFKKYTTVFRNSWQRQLEYRVNNVIQVLLAVIALISVFYLWNDVFRGRAAIAGYSHEQMVTYYILTTYLLTSIFSGLEIANDIEYGQLSTYLTKPISYLWYTYCLSLADRLFRLAVGLPVLMAVMFIFRRHLYFVTDPWAYLGLLVASFGAINILFLTDVIIGLAEFWLTNSSTINLTTDSIIRFFAGSLIPLSLLPLFIQRLSYWLPFRYTGTFLIDSFMGRLPLIQVAAGLLIQFAWTGALMLAVIVIWRRGLKRYEASGA